MRRSLSLLTVSLIVSGSGLAAAPVASAGTYAVWACANGLAKPLTAGDWAPTTTGLASSTCGSTTTGATPPNLQAVSGSAPGQGATLVKAGWGLAATTGTKIAGLDVWWTNSASVESAGRIDVFAGGLAGARALYERTAGSFGNPALPFDEANHQSFSGLSDDAVSLIAFCEASCAGPARSISAYFNAYRVKATVSDVDAPTGTAEGVADGQVLDAPVALTARASDVGGGVRSLQLLVDGTVLDSREVGGQCADIDPATGDSRDYAVMRPCATSFPADGAAPASFTLTPQMLGGAGAHTVAIVANDAAGNATTLLSRTVGVNPAFLDGPVPAGGYDAARNLFFNPDRDTHSSARLNGVPTGEPPASIFGAKMTLSFVVKHKTGKGRKRRTVKSYTRRRTVSFGTSVRLRATLKTAAGAPIVGARVFRAMAIAGGPWGIPAEVPLVTSKTGSVSFVMPRGAPSRTLQLLYFPATDRNTNIASPAVSLTVRTPITMSLSRHKIARGQRVTVTVRLRKGVARVDQGVIGALQLFDAHGWRQIRGVRFAAGANTARLVLRLRVAGSYRIRARVSRQAALLTGTGASSARVIRVLGRR